MGGDGAHLGSSPFLSATSIRGTLALLVTEFPTAEKRVHVYNVRTKRLVHTGSYRLRNAALSSLLGLHLVAMGTAVPFFSYGHNWLYSRLEVARSHLDSLERSLTNGVCILN